MGDKTPPRPLEHSLFRIKKVFAYEFFSGIGGFHSALQKSCSGRVLKAFEISSKCIKVYKKNFPDTEVINKTIDSLKLEDLKLPIEADASIFMWLLSPPCQPFTRSRRRKDDNVDDNDNRTKGYIHLMENLLAKICCSDNKKYRKPDVILVENVVGYEKSRTRKRILRVLVEKLGYESIDEYILDPQKDFSIPNQRPRYYGVYSCCCQYVTEEPLTKTDSKTKQDFIATIKPIDGQYPLPVFEKVSKTTLLEYIENTATASYEEIPHEIMLKAVGNNVRYDISLVSDNTSACLSKGYGKFPRGYGPLLLYKTEEHAREGKVSSSNFKLDFKLKLNVNQGRKEDINTKADESSVSAESVSVAPCEENRRDYYIQWHPGMHLRYFTPRECLRLLYFPEDFMFPEELTWKEKLSLCGNSLNVRVVEEIMKTVLSKICK